MSSYLFQRGDIYYYRRRVPEYVLPYEKRKSIKISLGTKDKKEAQRKATVYNDYIEDFWRSLIKNNGSDHLEAEYRAAIKLAKAHGFAYKSVAEVAKAPLEDVIARVNTASKAIESPHVVASVLGGAQSPQILLSQCCEKYWPLAADRLVNKSDDQIRKWKNPRIAAIETFIEALGDKAVQTVSRSDALTLRKHLMTRIEKGEIVASSANKCIMYVCDILKVVGQAHEVDIDFDDLFRNIRLKEQGQSRPPFEPSYVQNTLLDMGNLSGLNSEAKLLIFAMADTGARESELIGLSAHDIFLDAAVPHIWIRPSENRALKTPTSERKIPLVGSSLHAFKLIPGGFSRYKSSDSASTAINKYLRENNLKPSDKHSLYSLRHTFKDRLRDAQAPEEIIDELMGHKKSGPKYGRGHLLERKYEWMKKIEFKV